MALDETMRKTISDAMLLTRTGGEVSISEGDRRMIALYDNGIAIVARGERWSSEVKMILGTAKRSGYEFSEFLERSVPEILDLYSEHAKTGLDTPVVQIDIERQAELAAILRQAAQENASDLRIRIVPRYAEMRVRVFGRMRDFGSRRAEDGQALIKAAFAAASDLGANQSDLSPQQGALTRASGLLPPGVDLIRLQYSPTSERRGSLSMRLKYHARAGETEIDSLGYDPDQIKDIALMRKRTNGLYMLAGKVSSGKTTTLQRILNRMYDEKHGEISIYTAEEPVELDVPSAVQVPVKVLQDGYDGFVEIMKASMRSDPNVIVVGEIRSTETAQLAIRAVKTGHALWSTIHAASALGILDRLLDLGVGRYELGDPEVVRGLIYQRLVGTMCPACRITLEEGLRREAIEPDLAERLCALTGKHGRQLFLRGPGCDHCQLGLSGRTVVAETILADETLLTHFYNQDRAAMRRYWLQPKSEGGMGGIPVLHHALAKVGAGICDINEVEEEVDLLSTYESRFPHMKARLLKDIRRMEGKNG